MLSQEAVRKQLEKPNLTEDEVFRLLQRLQILENKGKALRKLRIKEPTFFVVPPEPLRDAMEEYRRLYGNHYTIKQ